MCGRYTLKSPRDAIAAAFDLADVPPLAPRYNIAPTQPVPVVRLDRATGARRLALLRWGLIPAWADDPAIGDRLINARAETVAEKPAFRAAFRRRRCLVAADGFYEWKRANGKAPYYFRLKDGAPFAFAGLWDRWGKGEEPVESCALITCAANGVVSRCTTGCRSSSSPTTTPDGSTPSRSGPRHSCGCSPRSPMIGCLPIPWGNS